MRMESGSVESNAVGQQAVRVVEREVYCESCHGIMGFIYIGEQHWPLKVAEAIGIAPVVQVWECSHCHTTVLEPEFKD
jgi:hypothetical protein